MEKILKDSQYICFFINCIAFNCLLEKNLEKERVIYFFNNIFMKKANLLNILQVSDDFILAVIRSSSNK